MLLSPESDKLGGTLISRSPRLHKDVVASEDQTVSDFYQMVVRTNLSDPRGKDRGTAGRAQAG